VVAYAGSRLLFSAQNRKSWLFSTLFLFTSWCVFLWFPAFMNRKIVPASLQNQIAEQSTFWQIIITGYVIPVALVVLVSLVVFRKILASKSIKVLPSLLIFFVGLLIATSGPVLAASTFIAFSLKMLSIIFARGKSTSVSLLANYIIYILATAIGLLVSLLSPGSIIRKSYLPKVSTRDLFQQLPGVFADSIGTVFDLMFSYSFIVAVISGLVICGFHAQKQFLESKNYNIELSVFFLVITFFSILGELYSYKAPWHLEYSVVVQYFLGLSVGKTLFQNLLRKDKIFRRDLLNLISLPTYFVFSIFGLLYFKDQANESLKNKNRL
jgi:hypothetical protein